MNNARRAVMGSALFHEIKEEERRRRAEDIREKGLASSRPGTEAA